MNGAKLNYINQLNSSGNTYDVSIEIKVLDPNYAQEYTNRRNELGSNQYYSRTHEKVSDARRGDDGVYIILLGATTTQMAPYRASNHASIFLLPQAYPPHTSAA